MRRCSAHRKRASFPFPPRVPGPDHLLDVMNEIPSLQNESEDLAVALGLLLGSLPARASLREVVSLWLGKEYNVAKHGKPSWRSMVRAIASPIGGKNPALAKRVAKKYPGM